MFVDEIVAFPRFFRGEYVWHCHAEKEEREMGAWANGTVASFLKSNSCWRSERRGGIIIVLVVIIKLQTFVFACSNALLSLSFQLFCFSSFFLLLIFLLDNIKTNVEMFQVSMHQEIIVYLINNHTFLCFWKKK